MKKTKKTTMLVIFMFLVLRGIMEAGGIQVHSPTGGTYCPGETLKVAWTTNHNGWYSIFLENLEGGEETVLQAGYSLPPSPAEFPIPDSVTAGQYRVCIQGYVISLPNPLYCSGKSGVITIKPFVDLAISDLKVTKLGSEIADLFAGDLTYFNIQVRKKGLQTTRHINGTVEIRGRYRTLLKKVPFSIAGAEDTQKVRVDCYFNKSGAYTITPKIDVDNKVDECIETNNSREMFIPIKPRPDLLVYVPPPKTVRPFYRRSIHMFVKNVGEISSLPCKLHLDLFPGRNREWNIPRLKPGEVKEIRHRDTYYVIRTIKYRVSVNYGQRKRFDEVSFGNNVVWGRFNVGAQPNIKRKYDLSVFLKFPYTVSASERTAVIAEVENRGSVKSPESEVVFTIDNLPLTPYSVPELYPREKYEVEFPWYWWTPGDTSELRVELDPDRKLSDNPKNNTYKRDIMITR